MHMSMGGNGLEKLPVHKILHDCVCLPVTLPPSIVSVFLMLQWQDVQHVQYLLNIIVIS